MGSMSEPIGCTSYLGYNALTKSAETSKRQSRFHLKNEFNFWNVHGSEAKRASR